MVGSSIIIMMKTQHVLAKARNAMLRCFAVKLRRERASEKLENGENKELKKIDHSRIVVGIASLVVACCIIGQRGVE